MPDTLGQQMIQTMPVWCEYQCARHQLLSNKFNWYLSILSNDYSINGLIPARWINKTIKCEWLAISSISNGRESLILWWPALNYCICIDKFNHWKTMNCVFASWAAVVGF